MSTAALIGIISQDDSARLIYCHNDGTPDRLGCILYHFYSDVDRLNSLIDGGDISSLGSKLDPDEGYEHSFDNPQEDVTVFYHRDRGEDWIDCVPLTYLPYSWSEEEKGSIAGTGILYTYIFDEKNFQWELYIDGKRIPAIYISDDGVRYF